MSCEEEKERREWHKKCSESVWDGWHTKQCSRNATVTRNGLHYCKQHDPEAVAARRKASDDKYKAKTAEDLERWRRQRACLKAFEGIPTAVIEKVDAQAILRALRGMLALTETDHGAGRDVDEAIAEAREALARNALQPFEEEGETNANT